jgi:hypothetical protein
MCNGKGEKKENRSQKKKIGKLLYRRRVRWKGKFYLKGKTKDGWRGGGGREWGGGSMSNQPKRRIRHGRLWLRNISAIIWSAVSQSGPGHPDYVQQSLIDDIVELGKESG